VLDAADRPVAADAREIANAVHFLDQTYYAFFDRLSE
jgi:hypothetical protein